MVDPTGPRLAGQIVEGLRYLWRNRLLRATAVASAASNLSFALASAVSILFMSRTLGLSPLRHRPGPRRRVGGGHARRRLHPEAGDRGRLGPADLAEPRRHQSADRARAPWPSRAGEFILLVAGTVAGELGQIVYAITSVSLRQRVCPDHLLGRVNATMTVVIMGSFPLGAVVGGVLGELVGLRITLLVAGAVLAVAPVVLYGALRHVRDVEDVTPS